MYSNIKHIVDLENPNKCSNEVLNAFLDDMAAAGIYSEGLRECIFEKDAFQKWDCMWRFMGLTATLLLVTSLGHIVHLL